MAVTNNGVIGVALGYIEANPDEMELLRSLVVLALHGPSITARSTTPAHVTCRAAIVSPDWRVLEVMDGTTSRWHLPGGHVDADDSSLLGAALGLAARRAGVETNMVIPGGIIPFDVDATVIEAAPLLGEPAHVHYDMTYLFHIEDRSLAVPDAAANRIRWIDPGQVDGRLGTKLSRASRAARLVP
ncbi:NUDIX family protein [Frankia canadensis]|uniref:NUDIX family protein n=1 Tax=Frankia canadensis TaxID=1836972 RepID=A0A2I2KLX2_9ACTN|nr:NUDIX hydrolase [Frankia canadensis]SNQ46664.1 NUDIX family protein [Frankia canadensis]SOU53954.1 NUDIX family protein [Frankia canadensis]